MIRIGTRWKLMGAGEEPDPRQNPTPRDMDGIWLRHRDQCGWRYRWSLHWYRQR